MTQHELEAGNTEAALELRRRQLTVQPGSFAFDALRSIAKDLGVWDAEQDPAEAVLRARHPIDFLGHLLHKGRDDEACGFALANPDAATGGQCWGELCARRARTHPADTLPIYRELVTSMLEVADRRNYTLAARQLVAMREAARKAGQERVFDEFFAATAEANRRRPTYIQAFRDAQLL